ncbi:unnamed protein product [Toxocara canis]|uniref:Uncharacterized protein n=1 Tax=Toxocara canis TaxID=6265 RepID=A0A3P7GQ92_TOXCA|nr:unnamed protein product [Toxocara canis]
MIEDNMQIFDVEELTNCDIFFQCLQTPIKEIIAQFDKLKKIVPLASNSFIGRLPVNLRKNRYYDIYCLDATRVTLLGQEEDYIHANYVRHKVLQNTFIITQGPLPGTIADFWRMIWQERTGVIFMLCSCTEENKTKCAQYLPNMKSRKLLIADLRVEIKGRWIYHKGKIKRTQILVSNGDVNLTVIHYQWTDWPDFKVPNEDFKTPFYLLQKSRASPTCTVVHCSGGVGRSGTLVALEMCLMQLAAGRVLSVSDMVACLRRKRAQSVQTKEQFLFIYRALIDFAVSKTIVSQRKVQPFIDKYKRICFPETAHI